MRNIEKLSQPIYIVKGLSDDYYHVTIDNTADGTDVLFSSDNGIELLSFVSGYNINAQIKIKTNKKANKSSLFILFLLVNSYIFI